MKVKVAQLCPILCDPMDYTVHGILQARIPEWVAVPFSRESSQPGIEPRFPTLQVDSLPAEPQEKPKNTGVCSPALLQRIFGERNASQCPGWASLIAQLAKNPPALQETLVRFLGLEDLLEKG